ncbi:MAG: hypothetical protein QNJ18_09280 [Xenococcaceae cyanobacterium MO_167.B52]|nr:hypothetical protein [Xenococcaceae cyanobacterium MO_167.B52]
MVPTKLTPSSTTTPPKKPTSTSAVIKPELRSEPITVASGSPEPFKNGGKN